MVYRRRIPTVPVKMTATRQFNIVRYAFMHSRGLGIFDVAVGLNFEQQRLMTVQTIFVCHFKFLQLFKIKVLTA
jgi:hypothetical protein